MNEISPLPSAGGLIVNDDAQIVLVEQHGNSWAFPKGHISDGETLLEAARREVYEETGLTAEDLEYCGELGSYERYSIGKDGIGETTEFGKRVRTYFLFKTTQINLTPHDTAEITQARWVTLDEALSLLTHPKDAEFLESVRHKVEQAGTHPPKASG